MAISESYTHIDVCPETDEYLSDDEMYYSDGVCPRCGHVSSGTITHYKQVVGVWDHPTFWERVWHKKKSTFIRKEMWDTLTEE